MPPQKILLIRLSAIGDILLATPLLRALRTQFPEARLDFVVKAEFADVLRHHPAVDTLYELETKNGRPELQALGRRLRAMRYDVIFDIHKNFRSRYLAYVAKPQQIFQYRKHVVRRWLLVHAKINLMRNVPPIYRRYLDAATPLGLPPLSSPPDGRRLELFWREQEEREADWAILAHNWEPGLPLIGLAPGAGYFTKRWPAEYFGQLAVNIIRRNRQVVILGGAQEIALAKQIEQTVESMTGRREKVINLTGALSLLGSAAVIKRCRLLVANDSGLMHVAEAAGTPLLAVFGSTTRELGFFPQSPSSRVIENASLSCRPCSHLGYAQCPRGHFRCMREITVDEVWKLAQEMMTLKT